jgi:hypothetical protein
MGGWGHGCYGDLSLRLPGLTSQPVNKQSAFTIQVKRVLKHQTLIFDKLTSGYSNKLQQPTHGIDHLQQPELIAHLKRTEASSEYTST